MTWFDAACYLAGIIVLAGCFGGARFSSRRGVRDPSAPWMVHYGDHLEVDMSHPQWRASFRKQLHSVGQLRRALEAMDRKDRQSSRS